MGRSTDRYIQRLYARLYDRIDLGGSRIGSIVVASIALIWLVCGAFNYLVLGRDIARPRERAVLAFGYGPAFGPLHVARARTTVRVLNKRLSVKQGALLVGGGALALCLAPMLLG